MLIGVVGTRSWRQLASLVHIYRRLTLVKIGNGRNTAFWLDSWVFGKSLSISFPTLYSHVTNQHITVAECYVQQQWQTRVRHLTSARAEVELQSLLHLLGEITLNTQPDERTMRYYQPSEQIDLEITSTKKM